MLRTLLVAAVALAASSCADRAVRRDAPVIVPAAPAITSVTVTIGDAGGVVALPDGPALVIPPHSLHSPRAISITQLGDRYPVGGITPAYTFSPHDIVFAVPATVSFPVARGALMVDIAWRTGSASTELAAARVDDRLRASVTRLGTAHVAQR